MDRNAADGLHAVQPVPCGRLCRACHRRHRTRPDGADRAEHRRRNRRNQGNGCTGGGHTQGKCGCKQCRKWQCSREQWRRECGKQGKRNRHTQGKCGSKQCRKWQCSREQWHRECGEQGKRNRRNQRGAESGDQDLQLQGPLRYAASQCRLRGLCKQQRCGHLLQGQRGKAGRG